MIYELFGYLCLGGGILLTLLLSVTVAHLPGLIKEEKELAKALEKEKREREFSKMIKY